MNSIGIGICTYNRLSAIKNVLNQIKVTTANKSRLIVADDGSTDGTAGYLRKKKIECIAGSNVGVGANKNRLLYALQKYDYIFILEDDITLIKSGWIDLYINAHVASGIHHFTFSPPSRYGGDFSKQTTYDNNKIHVQHSKEDGGAFSFYTKKVIQTCGGFCPLFKKFGWEHCEYSERIFRSGLCGKHKINHIRESTEYMRLADIPSSITLEQRNEFRVYNKEIWMRSRKEKWSKCDLPS